MLRRDEFKYLFYRDRLKDLMTHKIIPPVTVEIGLTTRCTHKCNFCAFEWMMENKVDIDFDIIKSAIEEMSQMGVMGITFCGNGEPLLYRQFIDLVDFIFHEDMDIGLVTNGGLLHKYIDSFDRFGNFTYIRFSLDAGDAETHERVHGSKDYNQIIENIKMLVEYKKEHNSEVTIGVHYTLSEDNIHSLAKSIAFMKEMGVDYFHIGPVVKSTIFSKNLPKYKTLTDIEIDAIRGYETKEFKVYVSTNRFADVTGQDITTEGYDKCRAQNFFTIIEASGDVYPCCHLVSQPDYCLGNINDQRFKQIWYGQKRQEVLENINFKHCAESCNKKEANRMLHSLFHSSTHPSFLG